MECLQNWLDSRKVVRESENAVNFYWKSLDCEICKNPYPLVLNSTYNLLEKAKIAKPYLIFELLENKGVHAISFVNKCNVKLGRGHDSDIRIPDISVSRVHATIHYSNGLFYIEDNDSKFGSLLKVESEFVLKEEQPVCVQIGRSVLSMKVGEDYPE